MKIGLGLLSIIAFSSVSFAETAYMFEQASGCTVFRFSDNKTWEKADSAEIVGKPGVLRPFAKRPSDVMILINGKWFGAERRCFVEVASAKKPDDPTEETDDEDEQKPIELKNKANDKKSEKTYALWTDPVSEFHHQAQSHSIEIQPGIEFLSGSIALNSGPATSGVVSGTGTTFEFEYGLGKNVSAALNINFLTVKTAFKPENSLDDGHAKGLTDPEFILKARAHLGSGSFHYGLGLTYSMGNQKVDPNGNASNESMGGSVFNPYLGYEWSAGPGLLGFHFSYSSLVSSAGIEQKTKTGSELLTLSGGAMTEGSVFYELSINKETSLGLSLGYGTASNTQVTDSKGAVTVNKDQYTQLAIQAYLPYVASENVTVLPELNYLSDTYSDGVIHSSSSTAIAVSARLSF